MYSALLNVPGAVDMYLFRRRSLFFALFCDTTAFFLNDFPIHFKTSWGYMVTRKVTVLVYCGSVKALQLGIPVVLTQGSFMQCLKLCLIYTAQQTSAQRNSWVQLAQARRSYQDTSSPQQTSHKGYFTFQNLSFIWISHYPKQKFSYQIHINS